MNELFSFREELTDIEIGQFANELSKVSLEQSIVSAFEMATKKIQEHPHCDLLIYTVATILDSALTLSKVNKKEKSDYDTIIIDWLERTVSSQDERVPILSSYMLAAKYVQMQKYDEAHLFLDKIPDATVDTTIIKTNILKHQEGEDAVVIFLERKLLQAATNMQSYLYKLVEIEEMTGRHPEAEKIAEIADDMVSFWDYGKVVPHLLISLYRKDTKKCIQLIRKTLNEAYKPWNMEESPLYYRHVDTIQNKSFLCMGDSFIKAFIFEIENEKEYEFLKDNTELKKILEEYRK